MSGRLPHMGDAVYTGLLVVALGLAAAGAFLVAYRLFKGQRS